MSIMHRNAKNSANLHINYQTGSLLSTSLKHISFSIHDKPTGQLSFVLGKGLCKKSPVEACEATGDFS